MSQKETLIVDLPDENTPEPETKTKEVEEVQKNEYVPNSWKKLVVLAVSYGVATKLEESPGPLASILSKLPTPFIAQLILTAVIYIAMMWLIRKFNMWQLD
jgi:hypothetical protein